MEESKRYALWVLSRKSFSQKELIEKLQKKGFSLEEIQRVVHFCLEKGFLNDELLREGALQTLRKKGLGPRAIRERFHKKGLVFQEYDHEEQKKDAKKYLEKTSWQKKSFEKKVQALQRRGFDWEVIRSALE